MSVPPRAFVLHAGVVGADDPTGALSERRTSTPAQPTAFVADNRWSYPPR